MIELLSPAGDFECLKAAVQNGADSVYLGSSLFSARAFASNFDLAELKKAIDYAKIRGVKTNLALNTLIKNNEFKEAFELAKKAYLYGIDAIIVQDLGLAMKLIKTFPDLPIHASTQMTVHNLNGALELQKLGFKRVVLSRELSINEIEYICKNTDIEIECFIHGALCISYSGQCLFSSILGGRSGNRGKCAGPCRLPFSLLENNKTIDSGYLLNTRDLCGLEYLPRLIDAGVSCLKIEGRTKSPEYVATVTKIYRKYLDLALSKTDYTIDEAEQKDLLQVFNRGMSSSGHLDNNPNRNLVFKKNPSNMGLFLGIVQKYNPNKGYITLKANENLEIGDTISLENESGLYNVSELMKEKQNIHSASPKETITIGRMKGNINLGDKIYKMSSKNLNKLAEESYKKEHKKILLNCKVTLKKDQPISINIFSANKLNVYKGLNINCLLDFCPTEAKNKPLSKDTVIKQIQKTTNTPFKFKNINVDMDDNIFLPKLSILNELRRIGLELVYNHIIQNGERIIENNSIDKEIEQDIIRSCMTQNDKQYIIESLASSNRLNKETFLSKKTSLLLNILKLDFDYSKLDIVDNIYIPLKYFSDKRYSNILKILNEKANLYIYMPTIIKGNYKNLLYNNVENAIETYNIKGFVITNICNIKLLGDLFKEVNKKFELIANYTFNVFNNYTISELHGLGVSRFTISPELDKDSILELYKNSCIDGELIVYGKTPLLNINYCLLGETDKCYPNCLQRCTNDKIYYLKDRLNMKFRILPDNIQTVTTIFNSKITSISPNDFPTNFVRIDILDEDIYRINEIIRTVKSGNRFEGKDYTSGNLNKFV